MPSANVDSARAFYPSERIDLAEVLAGEDIAANLEEQFGSMFQADFETVDPTGTVTGSTELRGMTGFIAGFREWLSSWESWRVKADDFLESGNNVLVMLDVVARSKSQIEIAQRAANVLTFEDGRVTRVEIHLDPEAARRAAGIDGSA